MKFSWILWSIFAFLFGVMLFQLIQEKNNPLNEVVKTQVNEGITQAVNKVVKETEIQIEENQLWVEVDLGNQVQKVIVREGKDMIREMPCSGGTDEDPTVMGKFYLENRGEWFYSERFDEGALYWVRFYEEYLFHSVPVDKEFNIIEAEKAKIGSPASHGCIRLLEEDAKWFYENVPDDTLVVIHD
ncbi:MAG: L,D-transpeptidase [Vallitaleaceae bacterium]|nr:L,D-transpeptidase [Vallitaleaceae bacterium]